MAGPAPCLLHGCKVTAARACVRYPRLCTLLYTPAELFLVRALPCVCVHTGIRTISKEPRTGRTYNAVYTRDVLT